MPEHKGAGRDSRDSRDMYDMAALATLLGVLSLLAFIAAARPLWYDELYSYYVARLSTPSAVLRALLAGADNGPPVDYWLRHFSLRAFGDHSLAFRLPSLLAMAISALCLWAFVRRRASRLAALVAAALPFGTLAAHYAIEGRAYALLLALAAASLWAWQRACEAPRSIASRVLLGLFLALSNVVHYYGVLNALPILAGELALLRHKGKFSSTLLVIVLSQASLLALPPFARHAMQMREAFWASSFDFSSPLETYPRLLGNWLAPMLLLLAALVAAALVVPVLRSRLAAEPRGLREHEWAAVAGLLSIPFAVLAMAILITNAMTYRYSIVTVLGFAILAGQAVHWLERLRKYAAAVVATCLLALVGLSLWSTWSRQIDTRETLELEQFLTQADAPVLIDSPRCFLESYHRLSAGARRQLVYLTDREISRRILGHDNDEIALTKLRQIEPVDVRPFAGFQATASSFYVVADADPGWLLSQLRATGAQLQRIESSGNFEFYRVSLATPR